jgi:hypothetical protein
MDNSGIIRDVTKQGVEKRVCMLRRVPKSAAQRAAEYRERRRRKVARMERIAQKAEIVNAQIIALDAETVILPGSLFDSDVETTLDNLAEHLREAARARRLSGKKAQKGGRPKKAP